MIRSRLLSHCCRIALIAAVLSASAFPSRAQDAQAVPLAPSFAPAETYRLRIENAPFGRIQMSADGGLHYTLIGRVRRPATASSPDKTAATPGLVLRSSGFGLAFSVSAKEAIKLLPRIPASAGKAGKRRSAPVEKSALLTDLEPQQGLFADLLPPPGTPVRLQTGFRSLIPLSASYAPSEDDVFVLLVMLPPPASSQPVSDTQPDAWRQTVQSRIEALGRAYAADALSRARADKRPVVSGTLTLRAKLPAGEPDPITAVSYSIDGDVVAAQNRPPYTYSWDTRQVANGEHVVEIRALDSRAALVTHVRALVVVQNTPENQSHHPLPGKGAGI